MSWDEPQSLEEAAQLAKALAGSNLLHESLRGSAENILLVIGFAKSMGISPFAALRSVNVIGGKPVLTADGQQGVVWASGLCERLDVVETTDERCEVVAQRKGGSPVTIAWDMARAKKAEIGGKMWTKYPRQMLRARVLAEACRLCWPDVVGGVYDPDELAPVSEEPRRAKVIEYTPTTQPLPAPVEIERPRLAIVDDSAKDDLAALARKCADELTRRGMADALESLRAVVSEVAAGTTVTADHITQAYDQLYAATEEVNQ